MEPNRNLKKDDNTKKSTNDLGKKINTKRISKELRRNVNTKKNSKDIGKYVNKTFRILKHVSDISDNVIGYNVNKNELTDSGAENLKLINKGKRIVYNGVRSQIEIAKLSVLLKKRLSKIKSNKSILSAAGSAASAVGQFTSEVSPLNRHIDKSKISDTGAESIKEIQSSIHTAKTTIKTVKSTIKTTKKTIKTIKSAPEKLQKAARTTVKVTEKAVKVTKAVINVTVKLFSELIAACSNPVILIILIVVIVLIMVLGSFVVVYGGAAAGRSKINHDYNEAGGLNDIAAQVKQGMELIQECRDNKESEYDVWIDNMYFDYNNLKDSDLVYMERYSQNDDEPTTYVKSLASPEQKQNLKDALDWNCGITDYEILGIAYVLKQKELNNERNISVINEMEYTYDLIYQIMDNKVLSFYISHTDYNQECPGKNCSEKREPNPERNRKFAIADRLYDACVAWQNEVESYLIYMDQNIPVSNQADYFNRYINPKINHWKNRYGYIDGFGYLEPYTDSNGRAFADEIYQIHYTNWFNAAVAEPEYLYTPICEYHHKLESRGLEFFSKDEIMDILGFDDFDKEWEAVTETHLKTVVY